MAANKTVWGIDLGQCALKAIRLQAAGGGVAVVDHVYIEHPKILSQPDVDRQALVQEAMAKFVEKHDLTKESLVVGVPGQNTLARFAKLPPVDKKKIPEIVKYEAQQQIPFDMDEVIWDYQIFQSAEGGETEVGIFAMRRELLRDHLRFLSSLNIEPAAVQASPLALYNALRFDGVIGGVDAVAILDIGTLNTDLIIADSNSLWTRNIPIGGNSFTEALVKTFKLSFRKAENLKRDAAKSKYARQIFQAMRPVFADLVAEVQRSVGFYTSSRRGIKLAKFVAMGSAFKLPGLQKFLQQNLGMEVTRLGSFSKLGIAESPNAAQLTENLMSFGVAYGLALQGLDLAQINSSLLPPEIAQQVVWRRKTPWFYAAAACLALSAGIVWARGFSDQGKVQAAGGTVSTEEGNPSPKPSFPIVYAPEDPENQNPLVNPQAVQIVQNGPSPGTPVAQANEVLAAGEHLNEVLTKLEQMNAARIEEANKIALLHSEKMVWPELLQLIHNALPSGNRTLAKVLKDGGPAGYAEWAKSNPREKREQVFIRSIGVQYSADVMADYDAILAARKPTGAAAPAPVAGDMSTPVGTPKAGFVINLVGRTPNREEYVFVKRAFFASIEKQKGKAVRLEKVDLVKGYKVRDVTGEKTAGGAGFRRPAAGFGAAPRRGLDEGPSRYGRDMGGRNAVAGPAFAGGGDTVVVSTDPVTKEPLEDDWEFDIIFVAVLGEESAPPGGLPLDEPPADAAGG